MAHWLTYLRRPAELSPDAPDLSPALLPPPTRGMAEGGHTADHNALADAARHHDEAIGEMTKAIGHLNWRQGQLIILLIILSVAVCVLLGLDLSLVV